MTITSKPAASADGSLIQQVESHKERRQIWLIRKSKLEEALAANRFPRERDEQYEGWTFAHASITAGIARITSYLDSIASPIP